MSDSNQQPESEQAAADSTAKPARGTPSASRRRLIRLGAAAVPVVATLTSRPALAWHCRSPSIWGSMQANPSTSLKTDDNHTTEQYKDETWCMANWTGNSSRAGLGKPFDLAFGTDMSVRTSTSDSTPKYRYITFTQLKARSINSQSLSTLILPSGVTASNTVYSVLNNTGDDFKRYVILAQLNYIALSGKSDNFMEVCVKRADLNAMVNGSLTTSNGVVLNKANGLIKKFLVDNYFATLS